MTCINLKIRTKKMTRIIYCKFLRKEITYDKCKNCNNKQYKEIKKKIIELDKLSEHFKESADKFTGLYYNLKDKFDKFIRFLAERLLNPKTKEKYKEFTGDLFGHVILTYNDSNELDKAQKDIQEEKLKQPKMLEKEEDDYEL